MSSGERAGYLTRILAVLDALDFDMSQVMVIAPFRDIAHRVRPARPRASLV